MRRGEVYWARLGPPFGTRPVVIVTRDAAIPVRLSLTVAGITTTVHGISVEVPIGIEDGMREDCVINADNILTIPRETLRERITLLAPHKMAEVEAAIKFALALR